MENVCWDVVVEGWAARREDVERVKVPTTSALLDAAEIGPGERVVELGCGPGGLARVLADRVGETGHVLATDVAPGMVELARRALADVAHASVGVADLVDTGLPADSADVVVSRMALMFTPEPARALQETRRVLRPGGRLAAAVWAGPEHNAWLTVVGMAAMMHGLVSGGPPVGPGGVFSLGDPDVLAGLARDAGFTAVDVLEVDNPFVVASADEQVDRAFELTPPIAAAVARADEATRTAVRRTAAEAMERFRDGEHLVLPGRSLVLSAVNPAG